MLHVLVHALACKAHGRRVRELGFFLLQGVWPAFYADVTDIFMSNRRARLIVDLAGPLVEVCLGSLAMLAAYTSAPGFEQALFFGIGVLLWESALINLYPFSFLELDGYHMLADAIAMPMLPGLSSRLCNLGTHMPPWIYQSSENRRWCARWPGRTRRRQAPRAPPGPRLRGRAATSSGQPGWASATATTCASFGGCWMRWASP